LKPLDLTNFELVKTFIDELKPDAIIHCAAEKRVNVVENDYENTVKINCDSTSFLAELCGKQLSIIYLIHLLFNILN
jgi:dTDP-4-dehydrorhamnose reductase